MSRGLSKTIFVLMGCVGLWFLLWLRAHQPPNTVDDAYITFRYARNLVNGVGFVYNADERVLGTTTPAYTLLLAFSAIVSGWQDFPHLALAVNALCDAIAFCLLLRLAARLTGRRWLGLLAALLFSLDARLLDFSTGGMESSFNLLGILLALTLFFHGRTRWAVAAASLATLIRPDGAMLALAIFITLGWPVWREPKRWPWKEAALFLAVVAPWLIFAFIYFGHPIPQSMLAKSVVYRLEGGLAFRAFLVQLRTIFPFSLPPLNDPEPLWRQLLQAALPFSLCVLGLWAASKRHARVWLIGVYVLLFIAFFSAGNPLWLGWYEIPLLPLYQLLILLAAVWLGERLVFHLPASSRPENLSDQRAPFDYAAILRHSFASQDAAPLRVLDSILSLSRTQAILRFTFYVSLALLMSLPQLSRLNALPWERAERPRWVVNSSFNKERESDYVRLAQMLAPAVQSGQAVAIPEIGAFGYFYPGKIFDTTGLVTPAIHKYFPLPPEIPVGLYTVPSQIIFTERPAVFITFDSFIGEDLLRTPENQAAFEALYQPRIGLVSRSTYPTQRLVAYGRRDLSLEAALPAGLKTLPVQFAGGRVRLEGYFAQFGQTPDYEFLEVTLVWRNGPQQNPREVLVAVDLLDAAGVVRYQILNFPGEAFFPTSSWAPGQLIFDRHQLKLPLEGSEPYIVHVRLLDEPTGEPLTAQAIDGAEIVENAVVISEFGP